MSRRDSLGIMFSQQPRDVCPVSRSQDLYVPLIFSTTALLFLKAGIHIYNLKFKTAEHKKITKKLNELSLRLEYLERKFLIKQEKQKTTQKKPTKHAGTQTDALVEDIVQNEEPDDICII
jgi:hypothetical protein